MQIQKLGLFRKIDCIERTFKAISSNLNMNK